MKRLIVTFTCASIVILFSQYKGKNQSIFLAQQDSAYFKLTDEEKRMPQHALEGINVAHGLHATLFASEPIIGNPTNIDVDAKGRVWMCEAYNYRPKLNPEHPTKAEGDRILILEDTNEDGVADTSKVYYQGTDVNAALGIAVLGNKVIVSCSPNVFVFTDTNGDDKPDTKEVLFTHVGGEQHDHAVHAFTFGPDGKLYFNFGNAGEPLMDKNGKLIVDKDGKEISNVGKPYRQGMVFRMNTDGSEVEVLAHNFRNNYEAAIDAFGTIWQSDNDDDGNQSTRINYVMEYGNYGYTDEMTGAGWRARRTNMETEIPKQHWHQNDPGAIPNMLMTGAGSPSGMCVYEGTMLPQVFQNQMLHCEPGNNVVRSYAVNKAGAGYTATINPLMEGKRDQWFRPIDVCAAPDGSVFVADWYDPGVGGHQMGDMNRGRIYRLTADKATTYKHIALDINTPDAAIAALQNANGATRYLAWQQLQQWGTTAEPSLVKAWQSTNSRSRARALWLLSKIKGKEEGYLKAAITDKDPDIRITGIRAARQLNKDITPLLKLVSNDADVQVRREVAIALHHNKSPQAPALWAELASQYDGNDRWYLEALGIGADEQWEPFMAALMSKTGNALSPAVHDIVWRSRSKDALPILSQFIANEQTTPAKRLQYFRAFDFISSPDKQNILLALLSNNGRYKDDIIVNTLNILEPATLASSSVAKAALNQSLQKVTGTQQYVDLIRRYNVQGQQNSLLKMALNMPDSSLGNDAAGLLVTTGGAALLKTVIKGQDTTKAIAALKTLGHVGTNESYSMLQQLIGDPTLKTSLRVRVIKAMAEGWNESEMLLKMLRQNKIPKALQATAATALTTSFRKDVRTGAQAFLQNSPGSKPLPVINTLAKISGDAMAGRKVFSTLCIACHQVGAEGVLFGPALTKIGSKLTKNALYEAIIHPDAGISFGYEGYVFNLKDGNTVAGIVSSETGDAIEVLSPGGMKKKYEKSEIMSRKMMDNSMMPAGLHEAISQKELVNLVEYLFSLKEPSTASR